MIVDSGINGLKDRGGKNPGKGKQRDKGTSSTKPVKGDTEEYPTKPQRKLRMRPEHLVDDGGFLSPPVRKGKPKSNPGHADVDDGGFPAYIPTKQVGLPKAEPAKRAPTEPDPPLDEAGYPLIPINNTPKAGGGKPSVTTGRNNTVTAPTEVRSGYAHLIDKSTPERRAQTLGDAADAARTEARKSEEKARSLRAEAAGLDDKPGMAATAEEFRREAAALEDVAENRLGMAAAYEEAATAEAKAVA